MNTQQALRAEFEAFWLLTRGKKKADRELVRHSLQPQCYVQDSANRHWTTWQAACQKALAEPQDASAKTWCAYVAGMIGAYLGEPVDSDKCKAIAAIIERRLWALPPAQPQAQGNEGLMKFLSAAKDAGITHWNEDLTDRLVAVSSAIADSDDRAAQSMLSETLKLLAKPQAQGEADMPAICAALGFDPTNHHNAAKCPYCTPQTPRAALGTEGLRFCGWLSTANTGPGVCDPLFIAQRAKPTGFSAEYIPAYTIDVPHTQSSQPAAPEAL